MSKKKNDHELVQDDPIVLGFIDQTQKKWVRVTYRGNSALVPYKSFSNRGAVLAELAEKGVVVIPSNDKASIMEQAGALTDFAGLLIFKTPGWCMGQFANSSGTIFAPAGVVKGEIGYTIDPIKCAKRGTQNAWKKQVCRPLMGHPIPSFFIMATFAAPLLGIIKRAENFGFEIAGEGATGKSSIQRIMGSVAGPVFEDEGTYLTSFDATPIGLQRLMELYSDMPYIIEEANLFGAGTANGATEKLVSAFCFKMSGGNSRVTAYTTKQARTRFVYVTSANEPFHELLGHAHRDVANAASDRLISIAVPKGGAGVFGPLPSEYEDYRQFVQSIEAGMTEQYGTAMPRFLRALVKARHENEGDLRKCVRTYADAFMHAVGIRKNGSDGRVGEAFGLVYAAGVLAAKWRVIPKDFDCLGAATHCYDNFRNAFPMRRSLPERILDIAARPQTLKIDPANLPNLTDEEMEQAGAFLRKVKGETLLLMTVAFGSSAFRDWNSLKRTPDFAALNRRDADRRGCRTYSCRVRKNSKDRFYAFRLPKKPRS